MEPRTIDAPANAYNLRAFVGDGHLAAAGNPCLVAVESQPPQTRPGPATATQCITWPIDEHRAGVGCWTADGTPIQCCGHGLLSCAALWSRRWPGDGMLMGMEAEVPCRTLSDQHWIGLPSVDVTPGEPLDGIVRLLGATQEPTHGAEIGEHDGYLIVEMPDGTDLGTLAPPGAELARLTARALIVTCTMGEQKAKPLVHLRYFAPQYGVAEDSATGSAMRLLAAYWHARGLGKELTALQRSANGGLLHSRVEADYTWVGGRVHHG